MSTKDSDDAPKLSAPEHQSLKAQDVQGVRNASGEVIKATEATRTNASDGSLRDRSKPTAERDDSIQIMGMNGRAASRTNRLSESELVGQDGRETATRSIDIRELLAKPEKEAQSLVEEFGRVTNMREGADRDAAFSRVQQLADETYGRGQFANRDQVSGIEPTADKIQIGGRFYNRNQILSSNNVQPNVVTDATGAVVVETNKDRIEPKPVEKTSPTLIKSGLDYNTENVSVSQKFAAFVNSAQARLLDPAGRKAYFQGIIDETLGIGEGLNIAKEEVKESTKIAASKAWNALANGSVANFMATPNAINEPLFKTIGSCLDTMSRDPNAINNVLIVMGRTLQDASDKYSKMSPHDRGVQDGKAMFFFVNPEGSTEGGELAAKIADKVATRVDGAVNTGFEHAGKVGADIANAAADKAKEVQQVVQDIAQGGGPRLQTAGGPSGTFDNASVPINRPPQAGARIETRYMSKADDLSGIGKGPELQEGRLSKVGSVQETFVAINGKIPPEDGFKATMRIREQFGEAYKQLGLDVNEKNVSFAEIEMSGKPRQMIAMNGGKSPAGTIGVPENPQFTVFHSGAQRRDADAEYKIMEEIVKGVMEGPDGPVGKVALYTEQMPCPKSCEKVIAQFRLRFPNIKFETSFSFRDKYERIGAVYEELMK